MREFSLDENLSEPTFTYTLLLDGTVDDDRVTAVSGELDWAWADEPGADKQPLGETAINTHLRVPFENPDRRPIRIGVVGKTKRGNRSVNDIRKARQTVFYPPDVPVISAIDFDAGTDDVTLDFVGNGSEGDIYVHRKIDSGDFAIIDTVAFDEIVYIDSPAIDGTYYYKLTQENVNGESNTVSVVVDVDTAPAGSPPDSLNAVLVVANTVDLDWSNNGGTGNNVVERRSTAFGGESFAAVATESSGATTSSDIVPVMPYNIIYIYRVRNESVSGYSNEVDVYVPSGGEF